MKNRIHFRSYLLLTVTQMSKLLTNIDYYHKSLLHNYFCAFLNIIACDIYSNSINKLQI